MEIFLRALELEDYALINNWRNDIDISKCVTGNFYFVSREREKKWIESKIFDDSKNLYLGICETKSQILIGYCSLNNIDLRNLKAEWGGTLISPEYIGKGYGKLSAKLMLRFLFDQYPINRCYAYCLENHPITINLFENLGFKKEGILREDVYKNGKFHNLVLYSLLRKEIADQF